jgi:hypothetical protein
MAAGCLAALLTVVGGVAEASSLRYYGNGVNDIDRVKIRIDNPADNNPGPPADVGATDFTIEFWLRATNDNTAGAISCGSNYDWINGNVVIDRDRFSKPRAFGISLGAGRPVFGVNVDNFSRTICAGSDLRDGAWHHVAVQRRVSDGFLWLYVDGVLEASGDGPDGDISYPDDGNPEEFCSLPSCAFSDPFLVIGAEKHDAGPQYPSFSGWVDELRLSTVLRYSGASFAVPVQPFVADGQTAALYHFDEGTGDFIGDSAFNGASPGVRRFGGSPAGPVWSADTPFAASGDPGVLQFTATAFAAGEGDGAATVSVSRSSGNAGAVTVDMSTADGSATAGSDYQPAITTLSWADGETGTRDVAIGIVDDSQFEGDETVNLTLDNVTGGAAIGARDTATLTISDDDTASPGTLALSASSYSVGEGATTLQVTVTRSGGADGAVSVAYATQAGSATAGSDFESASGTLTWTDGDASSKPLTVTILNDGTDESNETFTLSLSSPGGGASLGTPAQATVTILDDDDAPPVTPPPTSSGGGGAGSDLVALLLLAAGLRRRWHPSR